MSTMWRPMSTGPRKNMMRAMQEKPAKAMARTTASRHGRRRTNRGAPRRACNYRPCKHQAHGKEARRSLFKTDPAARSTGMRSVDREALILPDWLVRQYWQTAGIQADQDYQCCCVTDKEARGEYCSSTPGQSEAKGDGPAPEDRGHGRNSEPAASGENPATGAALQHDGGSRRPGAEATSTARARDEEHDDRVSIASWAQQRYW